ncbi:MAG: PAS domain S-box protein, partial [Ignavibacteriales bacterium]
EGRDVNLITIKDITENKLAQDILANSEQRFKSVWENALDAMRLTDENGTIVLVNQAYCNLVEKKRVEVEGSNLSVVSQKEYKNIVQTKYIENFHHRNFNTKYECYLELWNNKKVYVEVAHSFISIAEHPELLLTVFHDISSRKIAEDDLKLSEEKYRNLFDTMPNGYYKSTRDGYFIDANSAFIKMLGYESLEELKKIYIPETIYVKPSEREDVLSNNPEFVEHLETYRLKTKDGRIIWIEDNARYITDEDGNILYNEGICKEITDRKNAEDAIHESEIRFSIAFNSSPAPLVISEIESGKIIDVNEQWIRMLGYSREENLGRSSKDLGIWTDSFIRDQAINDAKEKRYFKNIPVRFITKSGDFRDVYWSAEVISLKGNDVLLSMIYDYTEQKISEDRLKENEERFRITIEQTEQIVYDLDIVTGRIIWNGAVEKLTGYYYEEFQEFDVNKWEELIHPEDRKSAIELLNKVISDVSIYKMEYRLEKKNGSYIFVEDNGIVLQGKDVKAARMLGTLKDISDRKLTLIREQERTNRIEMQSSALVEISTHESLLK